MRQKMKNQLDEILTKLTNEEKETIIRFDQTMNKASVFTYNNRWIKHLETKLKLKPIMVNEFGGKEYEVDRSRISMPRAPQAKKVLTEVY